MASQLSGLRPNALERRKAISGLTLFLPNTEIINRCPPPFGGQIRRDNALVMVRYSGRIKPGPACQAFFLAFFAALFSFGVLAATFLPSLLLFCSLPICAPRMLARIIHESL